VGRGVSRALAKQFLAVKYKKKFGRNLFKAKDNNFCYNITGEGIGIGNIKDPRSDCDTAKVNQFLKYSKPSSPSLLFLTCRLVAARP
jgi:hypothetical protein